MKELARSYVWWPNIDIDLETQVKQCNQYQLNQPSIPAIPMHPWDVLVRTASATKFTLTMQLFFMGKTIIITIDAHFKWIEVEVVNSATTQATVEYLQSIFA